MTTVVDARLTAPACTARSPTTTVNRQPRRQAQHDGGLFGDRKNTQVLDYRRSEAAPIVDAPMPMESR